MQGHLGVPRCHSERWDRQTVSTGAVVRDLERLDAIEDQFHPLLSFLGLIRHPKSDLAPCPLLEHRSSVEQCARGSRELP
jgi:hypothetical protein